MNNTTYINQYLDNELSLEERQAFENALASDETLQKNLSQEQAIREQFDFERTKLSVLALHEQKKKKAEQERLIQEQFDFLKTKNDVLALHKRKKEEKQNDEKEAKIVTIPQKSNWYGFAIAASLIGVLLTVSILFFNQKNKSQEIVNQEVVKPKEEINLPISQPSNDTIKEEKVVITKEKDKNFRKKNDKEERLAATNPTVSKAYNDFYNARMSNVRSGTMAINNTDAFENAKILLKNGKIQDAYKQLELLHKQEPNEIEFTLFFALASYKLNKIPEATTLLESIKDKNKDVEKFFMDIK